MSKARWALTGFIVAIVGALIAYGFVEGNRFSRRDPRIRLGAGPLVGGYDLRIGAPTLLVVGVAALVMVAGPALATRLRWRALVAVTSVATSAFTVALLVNDSRRVVLEPVVNKNEYWQALHKLPTVGTFVRTFITRIDTYSVHTRGHPPGFDVMLLGLRSVGLTNPWFTAALSWIGAGVGAAAVVMTVGHVAGGAAARRLAPVLVVAPYAVWAGTSADAVYVAVSASGIAALAVAVTSSGVRRWVLAALSGLILALACFGTYGGVMLAPLALAVIVRRRAWSLIPVALAAGAVVVGAWAWAGFWWLDGLSDVRRQYWLGTAQFRSAWPFAAFGLAALAIASPQAPVMS